MSEPSNIAVAVDAEINVLERRLTKLREIKRLALELDGTRLPAAAVQRTKQTGRKRQSPTLTTADVIDAARDLLADGPVTVNSILGQLGRSRTAKAEAAVEEALEQLGAVTAGVVRGGGTAYTLRSQEPEPEPFADREEEQLHAYVRGILQRQVDASAEELQYQLRRRHGIELSLVEAHRERELARNGDSP